MVYDTAGDQDHSDEGGNHGKSRLANAGAALVYLYDKSGLVV